MTEPSTSAATTTAQSTSAQSAPASRKDRIAARLVDLLLPISGRDRSRLAWAVLDSGKLAYQVEPAAQSL